MKRFKLGQRVRVLRAASERGVYDERGIEVDIAGRIVRLRYKDHGAFIALDRRGPEATHGFPPQDERGTWVLSFPEWCEVEP